MRTSLIVNPASGGGVARRVAEPVTRELCRAVPGLEATAGRDAAATRALAEAARDRGDDAVIVLGGDGTVHVVAQILAGTSTALAVVPTGNGNDLAATLGIPADPVVAARQIADALLRNRRRRVDLGRVGGGETFATVLCTGFDAAVNARANAMRWPTGPRRYELALLAEVAALTPRTVRVTTDGSEQIERNAILVAVANTPTYGGGVRICPTASPDDGLFDVMVIEAVSRRRLLRVFPALRAGRHLDEPEVTLLRARSVRVEGEPQWPVYADGEPQGLLPKTVTCERAALTVVA